MERFEDFLGQDDIKEFFREAGNGKHPGHAYILEGSDGMGKKSLAKLFAMSLLCTSEGEKPCGACHSCKMALAGTHPDFITVTHEKLNTLRVSEIRQQVVDDVPIKPYYGGKKVYIIPDAQKMNKEAQNSLLKTIEEPPDYVVILLLAEGEEALLETIRSRAVKLKTRPVPEPVLKKALVSRGVPEKQAAMAARFARGVPGKAEEMASSDEFRERMERFLALISELPFPDVELIHAALEAERMTNVKIAGFLKRHPIFSPAPDEELLTLAGTCEMEQLAGDYLISGAKDTSEWVPVLVRGKAILYGTTADGWNNPVKVFKSGDILSFEALFSDRYTGELLMTHEDGAVILFMKPDALYEFFCAHPECLLEAAHILEKEKRSYRKLWLNAM